MANGSFRGQFRDDHIPRDEPPHPLVGNEFPKQDVPVAVEPDIPDDIPAFLLCLHLGVDAIGVSTIQFDVRIQGIPCIRQVLNSA